jgi:adenosylhomocysteinase
LNEEDFDWCIEQTILGEDRKPLVYLMMVDLTNMVFDRYPELALNQRFIRKTTTGVHRCSMSV